MAPWYLTCAPSHACMNYLSGPHTESVCMSRTMRKLAQQNLIQRRRRRRGFKRELNSRTNAARNRWMGPAYARAAGEKKRPLLTFSMTEESDETERKSGRALFARNAHPGRPRGEHCGAVEKKTGNKSGRPRHWKWPAAADTQIRPNYDIIQRPKRSAANELAWFKTAAIWPQGVVFGC